MPNGDHGYSVDDQLRAASRAIKALEWAYGEETKRRRALEKDMTNLRVFLQENFVFDRRLSTGEAAISVLQAYQEEV